MKKGMTLVEVLVSLVILSFLLGAVFTILNIQTVRASQVQKTSVLQTDAQVALTLLKWDLANAGLAFPKVDTAVISYDNANAPDSIRIKATGLGFESRDTKWSWLLEKASNTTQIMVQYWDDTTYNFVNGDQAIILDNERNILNPPGVLTVNAVALDTFIDPKGRKIAAQKIILSAPLSAIAGLVMMAIHDSIYDPGITLAVDAANNRLMRGNEVLLDNVEDLQLAYGLDSDGDRVIDTWTNTIPQFASLDRKWAIRYTLIVTSRPMSAYRYPGDSIAAENHVYAIPNGSVLQRQKRAFLTGVIAPPNLQP